MPRPTINEARSLEEAFFRKRDAELIAELQRREVVQARKKTLSEVSGITDDYVLEELVAHDIHAETLAAFAIVPIVEVAWADGKLEPAERRVLLDAMAKSGVRKDSLAFEIAGQWLERRPEQALMDVWRNYTRALLADLDAEARERIRKSIMEHARAVAEAAGGFLGFARISAAEEKVLNSLEDAFR